MEKGKLYLIPVPIAQGALDTLSPKAKEVATSIKYFLVERARTARRFLKVLDPAIDIDSLTIREIGERPDDWQAVLIQAEKGHDIGILSEAGCPGIADPGAVVVAASHRLGISVVPLVGPSSILLAVMASGFSGQQFCFHGYLPVRHQELRHELKRLEAETNKSGVTNVFMETPYRSFKMLNSLLKFLQKETWLCVAANITAEDAFIRTVTIAQWQSEDTRQIDSKPAIFCIGVPGPGADV